MGALIWLVAAGAAEVWEVGPAGDVATIAEAVAAAAEGDFIVVAPGEYAECVVLGDRDLRIQASGSAADTRVRCEAGVAFASTGQPGTASLSGLTITAPGGIGLRLETSDLHVQDVVIDAASTGVSVLGGAPVLIGLTVSNAAGTGSGAGLSAVDATLRLQDCTFSGNHSEADGGALAQVGGSLWMSDLRFVGNSADGAGGAVFLDGVDWQALDVRATDNTAVGSGGAFATQGGSGWVQGAVVQGNSAEQGGGSWATGAALQVSGGRWSNNVASLAGGAFLVEGEARLRGVEVSGNQAADGGGLAAVGAVRLSGTTWQGNTASSSGGAVWISGSLAAAEDTLIANTAALGGGVYLEGVVEGPLVGLTLTSNQAGALGGGLAMIGSGEVELIGVDVLGNGTDGSGGGLWLAGTSTLRVNGGRWAANRASGAGGAVQVSTGGLSLRGLEVTGNGSGGDGGWLHATGTAGLVLEGLVVSGNHSGYDGGLHASGFATARVDRAEVIDNSAFRQGAGLYFAGVDQVQVRTSRFCDNLTSFGNTAIRSDAVQSEVSHNLFVRNEGAGNDTSGAVGLDGSALSFNTFIGNTYAGQGGSSFQLAYLSNRVAAISHNVFVDDAGGGVLGCGLGGCFLGVGYNAIDTDGGGVAPLLVAGVPSTVDVVTNLIDVDPGFASWSSGMDCRAADLHVGASLIDAGQPGAFDDDGSAADLGVTGGLGAPTSDRDGDGATPWTGDCDDDDPTRGPAAVEIALDGIDADCDGLDLLDADGDGAAAAAAGGDDCDDGDATVHPGALEAWYDGVDADCDGADDLDADGDGFASPVVGGLDCDDADPRVHPDAVERYYDGVDADCDGEDDFDRDRDGLAASAFGGVDCDDGSALIPKPSEVWYDGVDADCDGWSDFDADRDGFDLGDDCADEDPAVLPGADEQPNGIDDDCDGLIDEDEPVVCNTIFGWSCSTGGSLTWWLLPLLWLRRRRPVVLAALAAACTEGTDPVDQTGYDGDSDGVDASEDCRDGDPTILPGAPELCNGLDDDCDGEIDEGVAGLLYGDADGDGHGSPVRTGSGCPAEGWVQLGDDCDDARPDVHPGAVEDCDGLDSNCSGDESDAEEPPAWHVDVDGDGYGAIGAGVSACEPPDGHVALSTDCDEARAAAFPGADELCNGLDDDCDGEEDEEAVDALAWFVDLDGDGAGAGEAVWACSQPAGHAAVGGDCEDGLEDVGVGAVELCGDGVDNDCDDAAPACGFDGVLDLSHAAWCVWGAGQNGSALARGDVDGDGQDDLLIANPFPPGGVSRIEVRYGPWLDQPPAVDAVLQTEGWTFFGWSLQLGDLTGDGVPEVISGAALDWNGPPTSGGSARVVDLSGRPTGTVDVAVVGITVDGATGNENAGTAVASGELTGDGVADLVIGAPAHLTGPRQSRVHVVAGPIAANTSVATAVATVESVSQLDDLGLGVEVGDLDHDGQGDLIVAAPGWQGTGGVFVFFGPVAGSLTLEMADVVIAGTAGARLGGLEYDAVLATDLDEDGVVDLLIGGPALADPEGVATGGVLWFTGPLSVGLYLPADADGAVYGSEGGSSFGASFAVLGDVDGDGAGELAVGAPAEVTPWGFGAVHVVDAPILGVSRSAGHGVHAQGSGVAVVGAGDADGDGYADLFASQLLGSGGGQVCLWRGGPGR
jgi:hypothetical protein